MGSGYSTAGSYPTSDATLDCFLNSGYTAGVIADYNVEFVGLTIDGSSSTVWKTINGIVARMARGVKVRNCRFIQLSTPTRFMACDDTLVEACDTNILWNAAHDHFEGPSNAKVIGCTVRNAQGPYCLLFNAASPTASGEVAVNFEAIGNSLQFAASNSNASAVIYLGPLGNITYTFTASTHRIVGNDFDCNSNSSYGVVAQGQVGDYIISGNTFRNSTGNKHAVWVRQDPGTLTNPAGVKVCDNTINTWSCAGLSLIAVEAGTYHDITNNTAINCTCSYLVTTSGAGSVTASLNNGATGTSGRVSTAGATKVLVIDPDVDNQTFNITGAMTFSGGVTVSSAGISSSGNAPVSLVTNADTPSGAVLPFAATTGVVAGMYVYATPAAIPYGATVLSVTGTTVTISGNLIIDLPNGSTVVFVTATTQASFKTTNANVSRLDIGDYRFTNSGGWAGASKRVQMITDNVEQSFIEFNPQNYGGGLALGYGIPGASTYGLYMANTGAVTLPTRSSPPTPAPTT